MKNVGAKKCPVCGGSQVFVYNSREIDDGVIRRSRKCLSCGTRWETEERGTGLIWKNKNYTTS